MRVALDTNVLAYAEGIGDARRVRAAQSLIGHLPQHQVLIVAQTLGELHRVLTAKAGRAAAEARDAVLSWADAFTVADSTFDAMRAALDLTAEHQMQIWDALILSVAASQGCRLLLSEDFQHGSTWLGVTVLDPFATPRHPLLTALLQ